MEYKITIMEPEDKDVAFQLFESTAPFMQINKGDLIRYTAPHLELKATEILHQLWEIDGVTNQHFVVFTKLINYLEK
jgi:hypothetical protein